MKNYYIERMEYNKRVMRKRRRTVRKQKISLYLIALVLTLMISIFTGTRFTFAKSTDCKSERIKVYKSVVIYRGDTLSSIASKNYSEEWKDTAAYIHEVSRINHLKDDVLIAGNYLIVPYYIEASAE